MYRAALVLAIALTAFSVSAQTPAGLVGVWRVVDVTAGGRTRQAQPGLYVFTEKHYSMVSVTGDKQRPMFDESTATADELRATYGQTFMAQSGTYTSTADAVTTTPVVAKHPINMDPRAFAVYKFKVDGDMLTLTISETPLGPVPNGATLKLKRVE
jgi:Lipocalin-like domain